MMMGLSLKELGARLPPGFRFNPTDEELVCHYLAKKIVNSESLAACTNEEALKNHGIWMSLVEVNLHTVEPWQLPEVAKLNAREWYFFSFRDRKYATGLRTNRATENGYWKATGKDRTVVDPSTHSVIGMRKTLVFYKNRAPNGTKTGWVMHEFRLQTPYLLHPKENWVLCRVYCKAKISSDRPPIFNNINNLHSFYQTNNVTMTMLPLENQRNNNNNPATAITSTVTEMAAASSVDGAGCEQAGGQNDDFLWNNLNLEEINSFMEITDNNIQLTLHDIIPIDANSLLAAFF